MSWPASVAVDVHPNDGPIEVRAFEADERTSGFVCLVIGDRQAEVKVFLTRPEEAVRLARAVWRAYREIRRVLPGQDAGELRAAGDVPLFEVIENESVAGLSGRAA